MSTSLDKFQCLLDDQHNWPTDYMFKFIVPGSKLEEAMGHLSDMEIRTNPSKTGKYISITATKNFNSSDQVVAVYRTLTTIEGLISL